MTKKVKVLFWTTLYINPYMDVLAKVANNLSDGVDVLLKHLPRMAFLLPCALGQIQRGRHLFLDSVGPVHQCLCCHLLVTQSSIEIVKV